MTRATYPGAQEFVPATDDLAALQTAAGSCEGCDLFGPATQTVLGAGTAAAELMLIGEQPGDVEDQRGRPFVGPAGKVLVRALTEAGIEPASTYVTNAVKHFRFTERGKRRIHEKPSAAHSTACRPWLAAELAAVRPRVVVALGATAAGTLFGPGFRLTASRGAQLDWPPIKGDFTDNDLDVAPFVTIHPSAVLRTPDDERDAAYNGLLDDLRLAAAALT